LINHIISLDIILPLIEKDKIGELQFSKNKAIKKSQEKRKFTHSEIRKLYS